MIHCSQRKYFLLHEANLIDFVAVNYLFKCPVCQVFFKHTCVVKLELSFLCFSLFLNSFEDAMHIGSDNNIEVFSCLKNIVICL